MAIPGHGAPDIAYLTLTEVWPIRASRTQLNRQAERVETREHIAAGESFAVGRYEAVGRGFSRVEAPGTHVVLQTGGLFVDRSRNESGGAGGATVFPGTLYFFRPGRVYVTGDDRGARSEAAVMTLLEGSESDRGAWALQRLATDPDGPAQVSLAPAHSAPIRRGFAAARAGSLIELEEALAGVASAAASLLGGPVRTLRGSPATRAAHRRLVDSVLECLSRDPARAPSLQELASTVHSSPFHLSRVFKQQTGRTIGAALASMRVELAMSLAAETDLNTDSIARRCGFAHRGPLGAAFRAHADCTLSGFRKGVREARRRATSIGAA